MPRPSPRLAVYVAGMAGLLVAALWATGREPFSAMATIAVLGAGVAAIAIGHVRRSRSQTRPSLAGAGGWLVLIAALAAWQLLAYFDAPRSEHPTLSSLTNTALDTHANRALAFVAWLLGGSWLARR